MSRFDEFAEMDPGVEAGADEIDPTLFRRGEIDSDIGIVARETGQLRCEHHPRRHPRRHQPYPSSRLVAKTDNLVQPRTLNALSALNEVAPER
jgi:hypothetical protein